MCVSVCVCVVLSSKTRLLFLLCMVTAVLSAFLDNVTTILLIAPVTCKLCKLVNIDPRPFLICEAIFSNVGGTATMIGDPPNIIIGNMLAKYLDFNDFLFNLGPGLCAVRHAAVLSVSLTGAGAGCRCDHHVATGVLLPDLVLRRRCQGHPRRGHP